MSGKNRYGSLALWIVPLLICALRLDHFTLPLHIQGKDGLPGIRYSICRIDLPNLSSVRIAAEAGRVLSEQVKSSSGIEEIASLYQDGVALFFGKIGTDAELFEGIVRQVIEAHPDGNFSIREEPGARGFPGAFLIIRFGSATELQSRSSRCRIFAETLSRSTASISKVVIHGLPQEEILIRPRDPVFPPRGVDPSIIGAQLSSISSGRSFAGYLENRSNRLPAHITTTIPSLESLRNLPVLQRNGGHIPLGEVMEVETRFQRDATYPEEVIVLELYSGTDDLGLFYYQLDKAIRTLPVPGVVTLLPGPVSLEYRKRLSRLPLLLLLQLFFYLLITRKRGAGCMTAVPKAILSLGSTLLVYLLPELAGGSVSLEYLTGSILLLWLVPVLQLTWDNQKYRMVFLPPMITLPLFIPAFHNFTAPYLPLLRIFLLAVMAFTLMEHIDTNGKWGGLLFRVMNLILLLMFMLPPGRYLALATADQPQYTYLPPEKEHLAIPEGEGNCISFQNREERFLYHYPWILPLTSRTVMFWGDAAVHPLARKEAPFPSEGIRHETVVNLPPPAMGEMEDAYDLLRNFLPWLGTREEIGEVDIGTGSERRKLPVILDLASFPPGTISGYPGISIQQREQRWFIKH